MSDEQAIASVRLETIDEMTGPLDAAVNRAADALARLERLSSTFAGFTIDNATGEKGLIELEAQIGTYMALLEEMRNAGDFGAGKGGLNASRDALTALSALQEELRAVMSASAEMGASWDASGKAAQAAAAVGVQAAQELAAANEAEAERSIAATERKNTANQKSIALERELAAALAANDGSAHRLSGNVIWKGDQLYRTSKDEEGGGTTTKPYNPKSPLVQQFYDQQLQQLTGRRAPGLAAGDEEAVAAEIAQANVLAESWDRVIKVKTGVLALDGQLYSLTRSGVQAMTEETTHVLELADANAQLAAIEEKRAAMAKAAADAEFAANGKPSTFRQGVDAGLHRRGNTLAGSIGSQIGSQAEWIGSTALLVGGMYALRDGLTQVKEYQKGRADLGVALGGQPDQGYMNGLADYSRQVGENASQSFDSAAAGIRAFREQIDKGTMSAQDVGVALAKYAAQLGVITGEGQAAATKQLVAIGSSFGLGPSELGQVNDAIAYAQRTVGGNPTDIASGVQQFSKGASFAGMNVDETAVLMGVLNARTGEGGGALAQKLNRIFQNLEMGAGNKISSTLAAGPYGSAEDRRSLANPQASGKERFTALADIFGNSNQGVQNQISAALGGAFAGTEAKALLTEWKGITEQFKAVDSGAANGAGLKQFDQLMSTIGGHLKNLEGDLSNISVDLGNSNLGAPFALMLNALDPVLQGVDELIRGLNELDSLTGGAVGSGLGFAAVGAGALAIGNKFGARGSGAESIPADTASAALDRLAASADVAAAALDGDAAAATADAAAQGEGAATGWLGSLRGKYGGSKLGRGLFGAEAVAAEGETAAIAGRAGLLGAGVSGAEGLLGMLGGPVGLGLLVGIPASLATISSVMNEIHATAAQNAAFHGTEATAGSEIQSGTLAGLLQGTKDYQIQAQATNPDYSGGLTQIATLSNQAQIEKVAGLTGPQDVLSKASSFLAASGKTKLDAATTGAAALTEINTLTTQANSLRQLHADSLTAAIMQGAGSVAYGAAPPTPKFDPNNPNQAPPEAYDTSMRNGMPTMDASAMKKQIGAAVADWAKRNKGAIPNATDLQGIIEKALPGISNADLQKILPAIQSSTKDGFALAMQGLADFEKAQAPNIIANYQALMKAALSRASSKSEAEGIMAHYGNLSVKAAGNDVGALEQAFSGLDKANQDAIVAAQKQHVAVMQLAQQEMRHAVEMAQQLIASVGSTISSDLSSLNVFGAIGALGTPGLAAAQQTKQQWDTINKNLAAGKDLLSHMDTALSLTPSAAAPSGGPKGGGGAGHQYDYVKSAIAEARAARAGGGDLATAAAAITSAEDQLSHNASGSAAWWRAWASLYQAQQQLTKAIVANDSVNFMLKHDFTDPVIQAKDKALSALDQMKRDLKLGLSKEVIHKDDLALDQANAAFQKSAFDQQMSDMQIKDQLGEMSHAAYVRWLQNEHNRLESVKHKSRQQIDELNSVDQALQSANDSMNAQFNLTSIATAGLIYQVRAMAGVAQQSAGNIPGAGIVNNNSHNVSITFTGMTPTQIEALIRKYSGAKPPTVTTRPRRP